MAYEKQWLDALASRQRVYSHMQRPITMQELCDLTGICYRSMFNIIVGFEDYVKEAPKQVYKGRYRNTFIATKAEYDPEPPVYAKSGPKVHREPKPEPIAIRSSYTIDGITKVSSNDYHPAKVIPKKRCAWIGCSMGMV
jgi:hypothetical protein